MARILYDGLNLALKTGTGIATYTRLLARLARDLGHHVSVAYASGSRPHPDRRLREAMLFEDRGPRRSTLDKLREHAGTYGPLPFTIPLFDATPSGMVDLHAVGDRLPPHDQLLVGQRIFDRAREHFSLYRRFTSLKAETPPGIAHFTFPMPVRVPGAANIYTIHDLVPLRLPFATLDRRAYFYDLHRRIAREADHIVTVSDASRRDIVEILGVPEERVTNTYQAVSIPPALAAVPIDEVADEIAGLHGLDYGRYFLFFGAIEPKKNVRRLLEAFLSARLDMPLVIVSSSGWQNEAELAMIGDPRFSQGPQARIRRLSYVSYPQLVSLVRGARAVTFPSLYEGFGLPVLEAMALGTPVLTSTTSSLPEVTGGAALLVDPMDVSAIRAGIQSLAADDALCADLSVRGRVQAARFDVETYRSTIESLYRRFT